MYRGTYFSICFPHVRMAVLGAVVEDSLFESNLFESNLWSWESGRRESLIPCPSDCGSDNQFGCQSRHESEPLRITERVFGYISSFCVMISWVKASQLWTRQSHQLNHGNMLPGMGVHGQTFLGWCISVLVFLFWMIIKTSSCSKDDGKNNKMQIDFAFVAASFLLIGSQEGVGLDSLSCFSRTSLLLRCHSSLAHLVTNGW